MEEKKYDSNGICRMEDWLGAPPEYDHIDEELEADVIVLGGGLAGVSAARSAAECRASVLLFEKCKTLQCRSGDFGVIGSELCDSHWDRGLAGKKGEIVEALVRESGNRASYRLWQLWADEVGAAFDWYASSVPDLYFLKETTEIPPVDVKGWIQPARLPEFERSDIYSERYITYPCTVQFCPSQAFVFRAHWQKALDTGLVFARYQTPAKKLLLNGDGKVCGVIAQNVENHIIRAMAHRAVILATGDYSGDPDMLYYYNPQMRGLPHFFPGQDAFGNPPNTGDGQKMAMWIGASMEPVPHATNDHNMGGVLGSTPFLELDVNGERFHNEDVPGQELNNRLNRMPQKTIYQIFDANWVNEIAHMPPGHGQVCGLVTPEAAKRNPSLTAIYGYANEEMVERSVAAGRTMKADTIEELVEQFDISEAARKTAISSIKRYSQMAEQGEDTDFGKRPDRLSRLQTPPYYAVKIGMGALLCVHGGLECDLSLRVLGKDSLPIPGLYCAGNTLGGRYGSTYPISVPGNSHSSALTFGRIAGRNAAQDGQ